MHPRRAAAYTALAFMCLFGVQVLWTQGRLDQLRQLGRRGLRTTTRSGAGSAQAAAGGSTHLDSLALHGVRPDGSATGGVGGAEGRPLMADPALIVFCFNRSDYLNQTLHSLLGLQGLERYTVYVSQVGGRLEGRLARRCHAPAIGDVAECTAVHACWLAPVATNFGGCHLLGQCSCTNHPPCCCACVGECVPPFACCPPQDGDAEPVAAVAQALAPAFLRSARGFEFWQKTPRVAALSEKQAGHAWLAQHYKWVQGAGGVGMVQVLAHRTVPSR